MNTANNLTNNLIKTAFLIAAPAIIVFQYLLINSPVFLENPDRFAMAAVVDMTIFVPTLYYFTARKVNWPRLTVVPLFYLTAIAASLIVPANYSNYLELEKKFLLPLIELFVVGFLILRVRAAIREHQKKGLENFDFVETLHASLAKVTGSKKVIEILAQEISTFYYGLLAWRAKLEVGPGVQSFSYFEKSGYATITGAFAALLIIETPAVHLLAKQLSNPLAWFLTVLSVYSLLFLLADFNAARKRPIYLQNDSLVIRVGLRWRAIIPLRSIQEVELTNIESENRSDKLSTVLFGEHNVTIYLKETMTATGIYGITKKFRTITLYLDEENHFKELIEKRGTETIKP